MHRLLRDLRYGFRQLRRAPGLAITAVLTLTLAIGANTAILSLLEQAFVRSLPVRNPKQLVVLSFAGTQIGHVHSNGGDTQGHRHYFSYPLFREIREGNTALQGLIASAMSTAGISWNNQAASASVELVSGNYFETLGVRPALGRLFVPSDETVENGDPVAVLGFDYWRTHMGEAPVAGKVLLVNGHPFTILGVAAPGFHSMVWGRLPDLYVPLTMQPVIDPDRNEIHDARSAWLNLAGRLRDGESPAEAAASLNPLFLTLRRAEFLLLKDQSPEQRDGFITRAHINVEAGAEGFSPLRGELRTTLLAVTGMAFLLIAMAITNVASLLLVRAATRVREFSMRYALGATSRHILRQLLVEGLLLGTAGAALGIAIAPEALRIVIAWMAGADPNSPFTPQLDGGVLAFTIALTVLASLLFSLAPMAQFWNPRLAEALRQQAGTGGGASVRFQRTCVALQIGFSLLLIIAASLFIRTIRNLRNADPGFATDHLLTFGLAPELAGATGAQVTQVEQRALEALATLPGVRAVGATNDADLADDNIAGDVVVTGYTPPPNGDFEVELPVVSDGYLQTLGISLLTGRYFTSADSATSPKVAIVSESFATHFFGTPQNALGHHLGRPERHESDAMIVGVVRDVKHTSLRDPSRPTAYTLFVQAKPASLQYYVRTWQDPGSAAGAIRSAIGNVDSRLIVEDLRTMSSQIDTTLSNERIIARLATTFGALAALLAGIGLYGILAYSTAQRTREIGIRMALGAGRISVVRLILREVLLLAGVAVAVTLPLAALGAHAVRSLLYNVSAGDLLIYGLSVLVITLVAASAAILPARRVAAIDPARALRTE